MNDNDELITFSEDIESWYRYILLLYQLYYFLSMGLSTPN